MTENEFNGRETPGETSAMTDESAVQKPGARLAAYREKAGLSVEQVASRLKMTVRQVQQIEADNYESLSSTAIARGFVRAYARLLNVDPEPLVAMFPSDKPQINLPQPKISTAAPVVGKSRTFSGRRGVPVKLIAVAVVLVLLIIAAVMAWRGGWLSVNLPQFGKTSSVKDMPAQQDKDGAQKEKAPVSSTVSTEVAAPKVVITEDGQPAGTPKSEAAPSEPAGASSNPAPAAPVAPSVTTPPAPPASPAQPSAGKSEPESSATATGKGGLTLRAREKSWVQILRANSSVLFERTLQPGQSETIEIREPVSLTVGNARSVEVTFRGQPLELKTAEYSSVARMKLK